jgi:hypothetical protein
MEKNIKTLNKLINDSFGTKNINPSQELDAKKYCSEDIDMFFKEFARIFKIDMTQYDYYDYFFEDSLPFAFWISKLFVLLKLKNEKRIITVNHLILVVEKKKWFKPLL